MSWVVCALLLKAFKDEWYLLLHRGGQGVFVSTLLYKHARRLLGLFMYQRTFMNLSFLSYSPWYTETCSG